MSRIKHVKESPGRNAATGICAQRMMGADNLMQKPFLPIAKPSLVGHEKRYVMDCLESTWISSRGKYIELFESRFASFCQVPYANSCCNGTAALHLALLALDVGPDDEIILPTLSYVATGNVIKYCGGTPVFVDSDAKTWNIDPARISERITSRTRGIIVVHLYGHPCDMQSVNAIAKKRGLFVLEDAAEAHGAMYRNQCVGALGDIAVFSFFGNKAITTGEGGMIVTCDAALHKKVSQLKNQGVDETRRYWHPVIGYNYRMTNIAAAIGVAQLEQAPSLLAARAELVSWYKEQLRNEDGLTWQVSSAGAQPCNWMFSITLPGGLPVRDMVIQLLAERGVESRPVFYPIHSMPPYSEHAAESYPTARYISEHGISLPTWVGLSRDDVEFICQRLRNCLAIATKRM